MPKLSVHRLMHVVMLIVLFIPGSALAQSAPALGRPQGETPALVSDSAAMPQPALNAPARLGASDTITYTVYLPLLAGGGTPGGNGAIIIDHHNTDVHQIPDRWITEAKKFVVHYAHTSHGSQILDGLTWLEGRDAKYNAAIAAPSTVTIPGDTTALRFYDGNNYAGNNYITPDLYWESAGGQTHTRQVLNTGLFTLSTWTWCGQASSYSTSNIQNYLNFMTQMETDYPGKRFILFTGHTDGSAPGSSLWNNNNLIRQYARDHNMILFDFADIETYAPNGAGPYYNNGDGDCTGAWCAAWCTNHPSNFECQSRPSCAHTNGLACTLKGQAWWWLMARLAGWDGVSP